MMIADDYWNLKLSVFTMKFLEETGWYKPVYSRREKLTYLYGEGCSILDSDCKKSSRTCDLVKKGPICSYDFTGIGKCSTNVGFTNGCPRFKYNKIDCRNINHLEKNELGLEHGLGSRCFEGIVDPRIYFGSKTDPQT